MRSAWLVAVPLVLAILHASRSAVACGGSGPGGTGGCELVLPGQTKRLAPRLTASAVATDTTLLFGEGRRADMQRALVFVALSVPLSNRLAFQGSVGGFVAGHLRTPARTTSLGPGAATSLGVSVRAVDGEGAAPLVIASLAASGTYAAADASARHFEAYDLRATGLVGKTIANRVTPYLLGRVFGGPAFWRWDDGARVQGTDLYKFQLGAGASAKLGPIDLFAEVTPLGERAIALGATIGL